MARFSLRVNGVTRSIDTDDPNTPLLYVLRNDLGLRGPKFGCGLAQCGSCTVLIGGASRRSCVVPVSAVGSQPVTTLEGLGTAERPHPIQAAFIEEGRPGRPRPRLPARSAITRGVTSTETLEGR